MVKKGLVSLAVFNSSTEAEAFAIIVPSEHLRIPQKRNPDKLSFISKQSLSRASCISDPVIKLIFDIISLQM